jgi:teichoic acid transport system permease protein
MSALASASASVTSGPHREPTTVYEPTVTGLPPLRSYAGKVWARRPFVWHLARTQMKAENYDTVLGQLWLLLNPLLMAAVYMFVRSILRPPGGEGDRNDIIAHLITGIFMYQYISGCLSYGARSISANKSLVLNTSFPRAIFPLAAVTQSFVEFLPGLVVVVLANLVLGQPLAWGLLLWLPLILVLLTVMGLGLAFLFAPLSVFVKDTQNLLRFILRLWFFATPIFYTIAEVPANLRVWLELNPLYPFFAVIEQAFDGQVPGVGYVLWALAWAVGTLVAGVVVFLVRERDFAVRF